MSINIKLSVDAIAVAPSAMSVRSAGLGSLKPASLSSLNLKGRNLLLAAYAGTDARILATATPVVGLGSGEGIGLAASAEAGWQGSERTSVITRDERPSASSVAACEQQQVEDMAQAMGTTGFAGMHGYPSWRTRT
ncbi:hypothetical protein [Yinghuangia soli]|uniref:Uncharacterized protein n=1 Tax=Yinghuangia soli TaxID=2908204 RepID=A0AA41Q4D3_9ACTN|nr:hypothetical protein [Yinghuangia soli]MCF2529887.1 hypothetical protein [Yinghuangia soli]